ncbi:hypothetical protein OG320_23565 [Microbispora sp. NBC_01189]|uniref:hypothetical protein n=1 Tax=Microbispora sp. NBC_01189 TaxID=2903583 RepID=UPI002E12E92E|nr:hypothetical protein OG320_23565 [Microbispora sp. NBC_01189]
MDDRRRRPERGRRPRLGGRREEGRREEGRREEGRREEGRPGAVEFRRLAEDGLLQPPQLGAGLQAPLVVQQRPDPAAADQTLAALGTDDCWTTRLKALALKPPEEHRAAQESRKEIKAAPG